MASRSLLLVLASLSLVNIQCQQAQLPAEQPMHVGFLLVDGVYNTEVIAPFDVFQHTKYHVSPGMKVFTVAPTHRTITTFEGLKIVPDFSFDDANLPRIDVLVVASAEHSMGRDLDHTEMIQWVRHTGRATQYVMSLCDGAFVLAKAGLARGKITTTFPSDIPKYRAMFPQLEVMEDVSFVHDGTLITSAGGVKSYEAAMYLVEMLYGKQVADNIGGGLIIDWDLDRIPHFINHRR